MDVNLLIDGEDRAASDGATFDRHDPVTGKAATRAAAATVSDARAAVDAAQSAFAGWAAIGPSARRALLLNVADVLESLTERFIAAMVEELGSTRDWATVNVALGASMIREAAALTTQIDGSVIPSEKPGTLSLAIRQPAGVVLGMAPWNAPIVLAARAIATPLACGNTVVLKSSEACPATHRLVGEAFAAAGLPRGVVNVISHSAGDAPAVVEAMIAHPAVKRINFTGSTHVGRIVAETAARHLKPVLLELGGKAPLIVLDDADIDAAVAAAAYGAYANQGQICMSTELMVVDSSVADEFVAKLADKARTLRACDPRDGGVLGALVDLRAAAKMDALIADAVSKGAILACGGQRDGAIVEATLLDRVTSDMRIYREESFGPVKSVVRVNGVDEAVRIANDTEYGLSAAVYGRDIMRAMAVAKRIESGICHINGPTLSDEPQIPFGGVKASGYGRFGGRWGLDAFTETRWITIEDPQQQYPF